MDNDWIGTDACSGASTCEHCEQRSIKMHSHLYAIYIYIHTSTSWNRPHIIIIKRELRWPSGDGHTWWWSSLVILLWYISFQHFLDFLAVTLVDIYEIIVKCFLKALKWAVCHKSLRNRPRICPCSGSYRKYFQRTKFPVRTKIHEQLSSGQVVMRCNSHSRGCRF